MLKKMLEYDTIAIQSHNIPDADSLASGFALYSYFKAHGKTPIFFYAGPPITKPNLVNMIEKLEIPVQHEPMLRNFDGLLITVDCQYGMGNVHKIEAPHIAIIDHHIQEGILSELCDLRPWLGSCSTLVWDLLNKEDFPIDLSLSTALLYGLFMDTNGFSELNHPLDRDMRDALNIIDTRIFNMLRLSNFSLNDLLQTSVSLNQLYILDEALRVALIPAPPCDPNILGVVSDLAVQVDSIDTVVAYSTLTSGDVKFSVRTTTRYTKANDLARWLAKNVGTGGGHREKAGGYIALAKFNKVMGNMSFKDYYEKRLYEYYEKHKLFDCSKPESYADWIRKAPLKQYRKRCIPLAFVKTALVFGLDVDLHVRTLEGDIHFKSKEDTFLMIGIDGEVYPIEQEVFEKTYICSEDTFKAQLQYVPSVLNINTGRRVSLLQHAQVCHAKESSLVLATCLNKNQYVKIFTRWDQDNYYSGGPDDWFVLRAENDFYIVNKDIFSKIYQRDFTGENLASHERCMHVKSKTNHAALAMQAEEPFSVKNTHDSQILLGKAGDWLIQDSENKYEIVSNETFAANFEVPTH